MGLQEPLDGRFFRFDVEWEGTNLDLMVLQIFYIIYTSFALHSASTREACGV